MPKKKQKNEKKYHYGIISIQNILETAKKERKYKLSFRSVPTGRVIENSKKKAKKLKKTKTTPLWYHFKPKIVWEMPRK